jgi:hypothetical protein
MWQNAGVVCWLYVCMSRFMHQIVSGWVGFVGVWGGCVAYCTEGRWVLEEVVGGCGWAGV